MTAAELMADLKAMGPQELHVFLHYLADHLYEAELAGSRRDCVVAFRIGLARDKMQIPKLRDAIDFKLWLEELAEAARK
jgi:hypothetical protein